MAIEEDPPPGVPEWIVTYGDMMSLLLTFFIMLVSLSELKQDGGKLRAALDAIAETFGADFGDAGAPGNSSQMTGLLDKLASLGVSSKGGTAKSSRKADGPGGPNQPVSSLAKGTVVTLGGPVMFEGFSATLNDELRKSLDIILGIVKDHPNRLDVRGHASPEPLPDNSPFADHWELSFARARLVADYLIQHGIAPERMLVGAAGDTEPRRITRNPKEQQLNHRVDVFLVDEYIEPPAK